MVQAVIHPLRANLRPGDYYKLEAPVNKDPFPGYEVEFRDENDDNCGLQELNLCCAIGWLGRAVVVNNNGEEVSGNDHGEAIEPQYKPLFKSAVKDIIENTDRSLVLYSLIDSQVYEGEALTELGFQEVAVFLNKRSGNRVTVLGKLLNQPTRAAAAGRRPARRRRR